MLAEPPKLETQQCGRLEESLGLDMFPLLMSPTFAQVTRPIMQRKPITLKDVEADQY